MPQAKITTNAVPGSNVTLPINTLVQLDNQNSGGELTFTWSILDQPPGTADNLSSVAAQNPFFTPTKEGTYLIRLVVNQGLPTEQEDRVVCGIRQLKTLERIPAAGETTEADTSDGWATASNSYLRRMDALLSDPGIIVGVNANGSTLSRGQVLRCTTASIIKSGLPGQETVPGFSLAQANLLAQIDELLVVMEGHVDGSANAANGQLIKVRYIGRLAAMTPGGTAAIGDTVFVNDTGALSLTQGTIRRRVGSAMTAGTTFDVWFNGVGGADIDLTPIDRAYIVYGPKGTLPNAFRVDGPTNSDLAVVGGNSFTIKTGDAATVTAILRRFSGSGAAIQQWQTEGGTVLAEVLNTGRLSLAQGLLVTGGNITLNSAQQLIQFPGATQFQVDNTDVWLGGRDVNLTDLGDPNDAYFKLQTDGGGNNERGIRFFFETAFGQAQNALFSADEESILELNTPASGSGTRVKLVAGASAYLFTETNHAVLIGTNNIFRWRFDTNGYFKAEQANTQRIEWPSTFNISARIAGVSFGYGATDFAELYTTPTNNASHLLLATSTQSALVRVVATALQVQSVTNIPLDLGVNNATAWRVATGGQLQGQGGNRAIQNVLDPVNLQDAATKNYALALGQAIPSRNNVINGNFEFWQRGFGEATNTRNAVGWSIGTRLPDRWFLNINTTFSGAGQTITAGVQRIAAATTRGNYCARIRAVSFSGAPTPATVCTIGLNQEIDRRFVEQLRGRKVGVRLLMRKGTSIQDQFGHVVITANTGAETQSVRNYASPTVIMNEQFDISFGMFTSFVQYQYISSAVVPSNAKGLSIRISRDCQTNNSAFDANDYLEVAEVLLIALPPQANNQLEDVPNDFWLAGNDGPSEFDLCEAYYEKTYDKETPPGSVTNGIGIHAAIANGPGANLVCTPGIFRRKRTRVESGGFPSASFTVYSPFTGAAGQVRNTNTAADQAGNVNSSNDLTANVDTVGGGIGDEVQFHFTAENEFA